MMPAPGHRLGPHPWRSGSALIEFAMLVLPFLVLLFGVIEYARLQWTRSALQEVAIAGARCAGLLATACTTSSGSLGRTYSSSQTASFIRTEASGWYVGQITSITVTPATTCEGSSNFVKVQLSYSFRSAFLAPIQTASWPISATACFPNQS